MHTHKHTRTHARTRTGTHTHKGKHANTQTHKHTNTCARARVRVRVRVRVCVCVCMPVRKGVNTGYTAAAVQECANRISQWAYTLALKSRARPLKVLPRLAHACGRARPPGSRPAGGAERCQALCGPSRRLHHRADAANRSAGLRRDRFLCGLVSNDTFVRRRRLQRIAWESCGEVSNDSV